MGQKEMKEELGVEGREKGKPIEFYGDAIPNLTEFYYLIEFPDKYVAGDYSEAGMSVVEEILGEIERGTILGKPIGMRTLRTIFREFPKETGVLGLGVDKVAEFLRENGVESLEDLKKVVRGE